MKLIYDNGVPQGQKVSDKWKIAFSLDPYEALGGSESVSIQSKYTITYKI